MTYLDAGNKSFTQGKANLRAGAFAQAARDFGHAAEMFERHEWNAAGRTKSPAINISRRFLVTAIQKRDAQAAA